MMNLVYCNSLIQRIIRTTGNEDNKRNITLNTVIRNSIRIGKYTGYCMCQTNLNKPTQHNPIDHLAVHDKRLRSVTAYVIGSGIYGLLTAYELAIRGFHVIVLEERPESGTQCTAACCGVLHSNINEKELDLKNLIKGQWYWSQTRSQLMKFKIYRTIRNQVLKLKRRFWMSHDNDPTFEKLNWDSISGDYSTDNDGDTTAKSQPQIWMAGRTLPTNINIPAVIADPHFIRWLMDRFINQFKLKVTTIYEKWMQVDKGHGDIEMGEKQETNGVHLNKTESKIETDFRKWSIERLKEIIKYEKLNDTNFDLNRGCLDVVTTITGLNKLQQSINEHGMIKDSTILGPASSYPSNSVLLRDDCIHVYPQLSLSPLPVVGGVSHQTSSVDVFSLVKSLENICAKKYNVQFSYETKVHGFVHARLSDNKSSVTALITSIGPVPIAPILTTSESDTGCIQSQISYSPIVLATGSWIPKLTSQLGIYTPIYPVSGLSLLFEKAPNSTLPSSVLKKSDMMKRQFLDRRNLIDSGKLNLLFKPSINNLNPVYHDRVMWANCSPRNLCISAFFCIDGWSMASNNKMKNGLVERTRLLYPQLFEEDSGRCAVINGLRSVTADNSLIIGHLHPQYENIFINGGGPANDSGFTLAAGSAVLVSEIIKHRILTSITKSSVSYFSDCFNGLSHSTVAAVVSLFSPMNRVRSCPRFSQICIRCWGEPVDKQKIS